MFEVGTQVGPYELLSVLGRGGMATLFRARRGGPGAFSREVAVKVIHAELEGDPDVVKMFLDEARLSAAIEHPNVVHVEALGEEAGQHYIVMEFIDGVTLADVLMGLHRRGAQMPLDLGVAIASFVAMGLHAAHGAVDMHGRPLNLIHRDVSPQNIVLGRDGRVKLIDFGVAKAKHRLSRSTVGVAKGKLAYMAPEQLAMRPIDRRADVFALGTVVWEMLALRRLFRSKDDLETMMNIRHKVVPPLPGFRPDVPEKLNYVVMTMLSRNLEERFATAAAARAAMLTCVPSALAVQPSMLADLVRSYGAAEPETSAFEDDDTTISELSPYRDVSPPGSSSA